MNADTNNFKALNFVGALVVLVEHAKELIELKNLGAASVNILRAIGVSTYDDLKSMGSVQAYRRIKARGINVSKVMLYALEGALLDIHWKALEPDLKERLVEEAEAEDFSVS